MDWERGVLYVKSAQGQPRNMEEIADVAQAIPVTGPYDEDWPRVVYHGTKEDSVPSIIENGLDRRLAWGGIGTDRAHYHFVDTILGGADQAGIRGRSDAVVVVDLGR
eukprot:11456889-Alexandrium_andersonii.AAC.1